MDDETVEALGRATAIAQAMKPYLRSSEQQAAWSRDDYGTCPRCHAELEFDRRGELVEHRCCYCLDARFVRRQFDRSRREHQAVPCPRCSNERQEPERVMDRMGIPRLYREERIATWQPADGNPRLQCEAYVSVWPPRNPFLLLTGDKGTGKTHLACGVLREVYERHGAGGLFYEVPELLDRYRKTQDRERATETVDDVDEILARAPVLVLDDLGVGRSTEFAEERLYRVINHRYSEQKPLVVTTNVPLMAIEERIRSRLLSGVVVQFQGQDRRLTS